MKKAILMLLFPLLFLTGCGKNLQEKNTVIVEENSETTESNIENTDGENTKTDNTIINESDSVTNDDSDLLFEEYEIDPKEDEKKEKNAKKIYHTTDFFYLPMNEYSYSSIKLPQNYTYSINVSDDTGKNITKTVSQEELLDYVKNTDEQIDISMRGEDDTFLNVSIIDCSDGVIEELKKNNPDYVELSDDAIYCKDSRNVCNFIVYYRKDGANLMVLRYGNPNITEKDYKNIAKNLFALVK